MKALISAGGRATRLRPVTHTWNKHLIPLAGKPMLWYAVEKIAQAGISEIAININPGEQEIQKSVGDGSRWGVRITYLEQRGGALGLAHILYNAKSWIGEEPFVFYLGDNIVLGELKPLIDLFESTQADCVLALVRVPDVTRFGVPVFEGNRLVSVVEKPKNPPSPFAVTGFYVYKPTIFRALAELQPSPRGEYEISDAHTWLLSHDGRVEWKEMSGWWKDTGKPGDLLEGNALVLDQLTASEIDPTAVIDPAARIQGRVRIGSGVEIGSGVLIRGPVTIGPRCVLRDCYIGPYTSIESDGVIEHAEIEHSLIMERTHVQSPGLRLVDALLGKEVSITAQHSRHPQGLRLIVGDQSVVEL